MPVRFQKIIHRHSNTLTLLLPLHHVRHFGSTCNIIPPAREVGRNPWNLQKSHITRNVGTEISDQFYKEIPREIDHASTFLATSGDFWQFRAELEIEIHIYQAIPQNQLLF